MKLRLALGIGALSCFAFLPAGVFGQSQQQQSQESQASSQASSQKSNTQSVTGCLSKGEKPGEYTLTTSDGTKWNVYEKSEKLSSDVGNTVTITGHEWSPKESSKSSTDTNGNMNMHDISVKHFSVVSQGCK